MISNGKHGNFELIEHDGIVSRSLAIYGEWAEKELLVMSRFLFPGAVALDIGAYIGTHALFFSKCVGSEGEVHAFEPRGHTFKVLKNNVNGNAESRKNVEIFNCGLGDEDRIVYARPLDLSSDENFGGATLEEAEKKECSEEIVVRTIDSFYYNRLDFIKVDVEGMESEVLLGGVHSIVTHRPTMFLECNDIEGAVKVLTVVEKYLKGYKCYGWVGLAYNPDNFFGCAEDIFDGNSECSLVLIPEEKLGLADGLSEILSIDDVASLLTKKKQYPDGAQRKYASLEAAKRKLTNFSVRTKPVHIVVPFYKNAHLVEPLFNSLCAIRDELIRVNAKVYFYNDSPDDSELANSLAKCVIKASDDFFHVIINAENGGFISTVNKGVDAAINEKADLVILNSDTVVFPGAIEEMLSVADCDPMIGFVCPRSNHATLATYPHSSKERSLSPDEGYKRYISTSYALPRYSFVPTGVGFCMLIRLNILSEFGGFDLIYGKGYNEENDLVCRANRCGYRAVLANKAFVWHQGEVSFSTTDTLRIERDKNNSKILDRRYPEYAKKICEYFESPEYTAENLVECLRSEDGTVRIGFDFTNFGVYHNGTFEAGVKLVKAALQYWPSKYKVCVYMSNEAFVFHGLSSLENLTCLDWQDSNAKVAAVVRMGQPFDEDTLHRLYRMAPVVGVFMLDAIAYDCAYLSVDLKRIVWDYAFNFSDIIFTNSKFTLDRLRSRFKIGNNVLQKVSLHSLDVDEYISSELSVVENRNEGYVFIIGNKFEHKFVRATVDALIADDQNIKIVVVGSGIEDSENVKSFEAGLLSEKEFASLYAGAKLIVFPSHYEGFGFPLLHAMAWRKVIYVRDSDLYRELKKNIKDSHNIILYDETKKLVDMIKECPAFSDGQSGESNGWKRSVFEVLVSLERRLDEANADSIADRIRWLNNFCTSTRQPLFVAQQSPLPRGRGWLVGNKVAFIVDRLLEYKAVEISARLAWRLYKKWKFVIRGKLVSANNPGF